MERVPEALLRRIAERLPADDRDEMALPSYLHANPALRWMAWRRLQVVADRYALLMRERAAPRVTVDFGCGSGVLFGELRAHAEHVYGVDPVLQGAEILLAETLLSGVTLLRPEQMATVIPSASADVIVAAEVLEHVDDVQAILLEFRRMLKAGGRLLVSLPTENAAYRLGRSIAGFSGHYHHANAASIDTLIRRFGFQRRWRHRIPIPGPLCIYWALDYAL